MTTIDEIRENFELLEDWDDRYRYVIELGRTLEPMPEAEHSAANKVQGCASQVWLSKKRRTQRQRRSLAEISWRQRRPYRARIDRDAADALFGPHAAANPRNGRDRCVQRVRVPRTSDASSARTACARWSSASAPMRARRLQRLRKIRRPISAACVADRAPFSWRAASGRPHSWARPSDSPAASPIFRGIARASYCIASAGAASAT